MQHKKNKHYSIFLNMVENTLFDENEDLDDGPTEKKPRDITKVKHFNYNDVAHYAKDCPKVKQNLEQDNFARTMNAVKLGPNLILFKFKVGIMCYLVFWIQKPRRHSWSQLWHYNMHGRPQKWPDPSRCN